MPYLGTSQVEYYNTCKMNTKPRIYQCVEYSTFSNFMRLSTSCIVIVLWSYAYCNLFLKLSPIIFKYLLLLFVYLIEDLENHNRKITRKPVIVMIKRLEDMRRRHAFAACTISTLLIYTLYPFITDQYQSELIPLYFRYHLPTNLYNVFHCFISNYVPRHSLHEHL
ncbi:hypothetical protein C8Q75DRAFT_313945 [Abortiporus biennis]|nr:hypothetical protein C8Q75DRAFT_313945 [Abortiporus biennis]